MGKRVADMTPEERERERKRHRERREDPEYHESRTVLTVSERTLALLAVVSGDGLACALCSKTAGLVADHDHDTCVYRGVLCSGCNTRMHRRRDKPEVIAYLARDTRNRQHGAVFLDAVLRRADSDTTKKRHVSMARLGLAMTYFGTRVCMVCSAETSLIVDHDHDTGHNRGVLCLRCNTREGRVRPTHAAYPVFEAYRRNPGYLQLLAEAPDPRGRGRPHASRRGVQTPRVAEPRVVVSPEDLASAWLHVSRCWPARVVVSPEDLAAVRLATGR